MNEGDLKKDIDGVGLRITNVQVEQAGHNERIQTNARNIKDLWRIVNEIRTEQKSINNAISNHALSVSKRIGQLEIKIGKQITRGILAGVVLVAVPIILMIITNQQGVKNHERTEIGSNSHQKYRGSGGELRKSH